MSTPKCTICGKEIHQDREEIIHDFCDDGADIYAHMNCVVDTYNDNIDYKYESMKHYSTQPIIN